ncbi:MAG TPA: DNA gyrase modulator [Chitinophagaceae bacterium]
MVNRKKFIQLASMSFGTLVVPNLVSGTLAGLPFAPPRNELAIAALNAAGAKGASYADVRIGHYGHQGDPTEMYGICIRVIVDGTWGYAATNLLTGSSIDQCIDEAVINATARKNSRETPQRYVYSPKAKYDLWRAEVFR